MRALFLVTVSLVMACGCATTNPPSSQTVSSQDISPIQAVLAAAEKPVTGTFAFEVRGGGRQDGNLYLNSEADYRDQRCLVISINDAVAAQLAARVGGDPLVVLKGKQIRVAGTARRVRISFISNGIQTDKFYYQTHVFITDPAQIATIDG